MTLFRTVIAVLAVILLAVLFFALRHLWKKQQTEREHRKKGEDGEAFVAALLKGCMQAGDTLLNNVVLSDPRTGSSMEIDHILLSLRGIFVVETKNRSGEIYGDDETETWTQVLGKGDIRHEFYSPVKQCVAHAERVALVTKCKKVYPIVIFAQGNTQFVKSQLVFTPEEMRTVLERAENVLGKRELADALRLLQARMKQSISAKEHRINVQKKYGN